MFKCLIPSLRRNYEGTGHYIYVTEGRTKNVRFYPLNYFFTLNPHSDTANYRLGLYDIEEGCKSKVDGCLLFLFI